MSLIRFDHLSCCPRCGGSFGAGESREVCLGGVDPRDPRWIACSNASDGIPSKTGRTHWLALTEPFEFSRPAPRPQRRTKGPSLRERGFHLERVHNYADEAGGLAGSSSNTTTVGIHRRVLWVSS